MTNSESIPIACNLTNSAIDDRRPIVQALLSKAQGQLELPTGYQLTFADEDGVSAELLELIEFERRCCPFLTFELAFPAGAKLIQFSLTGPEGSKQFLQSDLPAVFVAEN